MRRALVVTCCWPGLSRLWLRGDPAGFLPAVGFAVAINAALWVSLGRNEPLAWVWQVTIWLPLLGGWGYSVWSAWRGLESLVKNEAGPEVEGLFVSAQAEYLRGHWFEAEGLALRIVQQRPQDVEGQLLLASLYRQMKRFDEARRSLKGLARMEGAARWSFEIHEEERRLAQLAEEPESENEQNPGANVPEEAVPRQAKAA